MRDRMILFRDRFDLDECFRCLLSGAGFLGGDPTLSGNWRVSDEFFDKFWFLTIDYNRRDRSREPAIQGLEKIQEEDEEEHAKNNNIGDGKVNGLPEEDLLPELSYQNILDFLETEINHYRHQPQATLFLG
jgi:hypothetical protein